MNIPFNPEDSQKVFHIYGWKINGRPWVQSGLNWIGWLHQTKAFLKAIQEFEVGTKKFLPFKTSSGTLNYEVERVR